MNILGATVKIQLTSESDKAYCGYRTQSIVVNGNSGNGKNSVTADKSCCAVLRITLKSGNQNRNNK